MQVSLWLCVMLMASVWARPQAPNSPVHFKPAADPQNPLRYRYETQVAHTKSADGTALQLKYDVEIAPHAVALSEIQEIEAIDCTANTVELTVTDSFMSNIPLASWKDGHLLNGGTEWGCKDASGRVATIMRRLARVEIINNNRIVLHTRGEVPLEEFFTDANIAFYSKRGERPASFDQNVNSNAADRRVNRDGSVSQTQSVFVSHIPGQAPKPLAQPMPSAGLNPIGEGSTFTTLAAAKFVRVTSPAYRQAFKAGDVITFKWDYGGWGDNVGVKISVKQERDLVWDKNMLDLASTTMSAGADGVTVTVPASWRDSRRYYILMRWNCGWFKCDASSSPFFQIPQLYITSPTGDSQYEPGQTIDVRWENYGLDASTQLKMTVYKDKPLWIDPKLVDTVTVPNTGSASAVIPMETERGLFPYYVQFEWNCKIFGQFCDYAYSDRFTLPGQATDSWNYDPNTGRAISEYPMISLSCNNVVMACANIPATPNPGMTGIDGGGDGQAMGRRLLATDNNNANEQQPAIQPLSLEEMFGPKSLNHRLHGTDKPTVPKHVRPAHASGASFSPQGVAHQSTSPASLVTYASLSRGTIPRDLARHSDFGVLDLDATDPPPCNPEGADTGALIGGPSNILKEICYLCTVGLQNVEVSMTCSNCWVKFDYTVAKFEFIRSGTKVESLIANLEGNAQINIELMFKAQYQQTLQSDPRPLYSVEMKPLSFSIAGIKIDLSVDFTLNWDYLIEYQLTGKLFFEGGINAQFSGQLQYGTQYPDSRLDTGHSFTYQTYTNKPRVTVDSSLHSRVTMHASLVFKFMNLLTVTITADPYVDFMSTFAYPPLPELTDAPVPDALVKYTDDCLSPHYIEFLLVAGMGQLNVLAELRFKLPIIDPFTKSYTRAYPLPYELVNLVSGCWLAPKSVSETQVVVDGLVDVSTQSLQRQYEWQVQREVAAAVGVDQNRVNIGDIMLDQANQKTTVNVGFSSTIDNAASTNPSVTNSFENSPLFKNGLWTSTSRMLQSLAQVGDRSNDFTTMASSTGGQNTEPPMPNEDFDPTPDTKSADQLAQAFLAAVNDPKSSLHKNPKNKLYLAKKLNVLQSFNPAAGHTMQLATPPGGWYLHVDAFFVGFATALGILIAGYAMFFGFQRYKARHGGGSTSSGNRTTSSRPLRSDDEDETGRNSYRLMNH